jgi:phosphoribosylformylglycinamidine synthase PurS subunit
VFLARIRITLRPSILDPQGKAVRHATSSLGMTQVADVRMGKYVEVTLDSPNEDEAKSAAETLCKKLLANPVMEDFAYEVVRL